MTSLAVTQTHQETLTGSGTASKTLTGQVMRAQPLCSIKFNKDCLLAHNSYRKIHFAAPLKLNEQLRAYAQEWANVRSVHAI